MARGMRWQKTGGGIDHIAAASRLLMGGIRLAARRQHGPVGDCALPR
jgi:hypothetical protein